MKEKHRLNSKTLYKAERIKKNGLDLLTKNKSNSNSRKNDKRL